MKYQILLEIICMNYQILFPGENKKNIINLSSAELAKREVIVKENENSVPDFVSHTEKKESRRRMS